MIIQKIYIEAYVNDSVNLEYELDDQLLNDGRCSWRNVVKISEEQTNDTFPEDKEERIREQMSRIDSLLDDDDLHVPSEVGYKLQEIADELRSMLT